jgi:predicted transcriptional regulator
MTKMWEYTKADLETLRVIEAQRRAFGMSQSELARRAKVARNTVANIERGDIDPRLSNVLRILEQLGIELVPSYVGLPDSEVDHE